MKVENGKIVEINEDELFELYIRRDMDEVYSFKDYIRNFKHAGTMVLKEDKNV